MLLSLLIGFIIVSISVCLYIAFWLKNERTFVKDNCKFIVKDKYNIKIDGVLTECIVFYNSECPNTLLLCDIDTFVREYIPISEYKKM